MSKNYIKLNIDDKHLSIGNLCRITKSLAINKSLALQSEIFCILFDLEYVNETTINNYCSGYRNINSDYKQKYLFIQKEYNHNKSILLDKTLNFITILEGNLISTNQKLEYINNSYLFQQLCHKLYNIAKNDQEVNEEYVENIQNLLKHNHYYECFCEFLFFTILQKKQPIYKEKINTAIIEKLLENSHIAASELEEFLLIKFRDSTNYNYSIKNIANKSNAYACYELGTQEYYGYVAGYPRYDKSFQYLKVAAQKGHPGANYLIANMLLKNLIGTGSNDELELAYTYLKVAIEHGSIEALNTVGWMYQKGIHPLKKDENKAIQYFQKATTKDYVYAYNNLGQIYEKKKEYAKAFTFFIKSANLGESWACNKIGEYYRLGFTKKDLKLAFEYYQKALDCPIKNLCYYAKYNLATYFYKHGVLDITPANKSLYLEYLKEASNHDILNASIDLLIIYTEQYWQTRNEKDLTDIKSLLNHIENHQEYNEDIQKHIETILANKKEKINIHIITD